MLHRIASVIKDSLTGLSFADTVEGLARPTKLNTNNVEKVLPLVYDANPATCEALGLSNKLVPDSSKKSIIYFEVVSQPIIVAPHKHYNEYEAILRLICWINYDKLNENYYEPSLIINEILKDMPTTITDTMVKGVNITFNSQAPKETLFAAYTYPEAESQYMTYPLDAIGLDFDIQYRIATNCTADTTSDPSCRYV